MEPYTKRDLLEATATAILASLILGTALFFYIPVTNAQIIELHQGSDAYLGEHVDISLAVSFPKYELAWCKNEVYQCDPPDQVIAVTGNMHNYYLNPAIFNVGRYYRWDGEWHPAENADAFTIKEGVRPNITPTQTQNLTSANATIAYVNKTLKQGTSIIVARGDSGIFTYENPDMIGNGHMWLFGGDEFVRGGTVSRLDLPLNNNNGSYTFILASNFTNDLDYGDYTGYIQFDGKNSWQDCYYIPDYKTPFNATYPILESPYKKVNSVDINGQNPENIKKAFETMVQDPVYSDDYLVPITMKVLYPDISIFEFYELNDTIYVSGATSLNEEATITGMIDPEHWVSTIEKQDNTFFAEITGDISTIREFEIKMPLRWGELSIDDHDILFEGRGYGNDLKATRSMVLPVSDVYVMPTPPPSRKKIIVEEYGWHTVTLVPTATPTPMTAQTTTEPVPVHTGNFTSTVTETNPPVTSHNQSVSTTIPTTVPVAKPTAEKTIPTIPVFPLLGVLAVLIVLWRKR